MELHFCSVCGYSIPNAEVDSGSARGADGQLLCAEHRTAGAAGAAPGAAPPGAGPSLTLTEDELELLFCANCRISVPVSDFKSGRARREYGSLLCAICAKADPGARAARRESVEAEMAADAAANDAVHAYRCAVCSVAVPQSAVVTGKAQLDGDRVTCPACRAAATSRAGGSFVATAVLVIVVAALAGAAAWVGLPRLIDRGVQPVRDGLENRIAALERSSAARVDQASDAAEGERARITTDVETLGAAVADLRSQVANLRAEMAGVRDELAREDARSERRLAQLESQMVEIVRALANRAESAQRDPPRRDDTEKPPVVEPPVRDEPPTEPPPVVQQVDPEVARLVKDLLESPDEGVRFPAANELGRRGDETAIPALCHALANDKNFLVRRACARSLSSLKAWFACPYLVDALEDKEAYVAVTANFALKAITGQEFEIEQDQSVTERKRRAKKARKWWDDNKDAPPDGVSRHPAELVQ